MTDTYESDSSSDQTQIATDNAADTKVDSGTNQDAEHQTESSTVSNSEKPGSLLDLVKDVVERNQVVESQTTSDEKSADQVISDEPTKEEANPASSDEVDADAQDGSKDDEKLPFNNHPRFKALIQEKNSYKEDAAHFRNLSHFMHVNSLSADEVNQGLEFLAALKSDPMKAREMIAGTNKYLDQVAGEILPDDVSEMVESGEISEEAAKQFAKTKAQLAFEQQRQANLQQQQQNYHGEMARNQIVGAIEQWDQQVMARDPDYQSKRQLVLKNLELAQMRQPARTPQEALAYADAAYKEANEYLKHLMPKKVEIKQPTSAQSVNHAKAKPQTLEDVIRLHVNA
jgi:hypothetical protein